MNIEFQCGALVLLLVLLFAFLKEKHLGLTNSRLFFVAIISCIVCEIFDIMSIIAIHEATYNGFSPDITKVVCKTYLCTLVLQGYLGLIYASAGIMYRRRHLAVRITYFVAFMLCESGVAITDIDYYMDGRTVYSFGPSTRITYGVAVLFIVSTIIIAFKYRDGLLKRRRNAMLIWQSCWLIAAVIQFLVPELLLVGFAAAVGMVILYAELENPNEFVDRESGLFTQNGMKMYVKDKYMRGKKFSALFIKIKFHSDTVDKVTVRMVNGLRKLGKEPSFRLDDNLYAIIYDDEETMWDKFAKVKMMKAAAVDIRAEGVYTVIPDSTLFVNHEEFFRFQKFYDEAAPGTIIADQETIDNVKKHEDMKIFIDDALRDDRVQVYYQPFYDTKKGYYTVAEALLRVLDEDGKVVPPMEIIPIAEENGQIVPLGIRIFEKVCEFLGKGEIQKLGIEYIEVNISVAQFDSENPYKFVVDVMNKYNVKPEWINLEITETASNDLKHILLSNMEKLIAEGVHFSLDDFGTGRSNLDYFVSMPVCVIKFDYNFMQEFFTNDKVKQVVTGMTDIFHRMGMSIVSEGIETREQMDKMLDLGIEYIQGYYLSRPINEDDFVEFLRKNNDGKLLVNEQTQSS